MVSIHISFSYPSSYLVSTRSPSQVVRQQPTSQPKEQQHCASRTKHNGKMPATSQAKPEEQTTLQAQPVQPAISQAKPEPPAIPQTKPEQQGFPPADQKQKQTITSAQAGRELTSELPEINGGTCITLCNCGTLARGVHNSEVPLYTPACISL